MIVEALVTPYQDAALGCRRLHYTVLMPFTVEDKREYQRHWVATRRAEWFLEKWCAHCGSIDDLECDHADPTTKLYEVSALWGMAPGNPQRIAELAKCQALCHGCHLKKTVSETEEAAHGTNARYTAKKFYCRCALCRAAHAEVAARYRGKV